MGIPIIPSAMLSINDLKPGSLVIIDGTPFQILEVAHQHIGRGGSSIQTKIRNIKTGQVLSRNFKPADKFEEADIEKRPTKFIYFHPVRNKASNGASRGAYMFQDLPKPQESGRDLPRRSAGIPVKDLGTGSKSLGTKDPKNRFELSKDILGDNAKWLKPNIELTVLFLEEEPINVILPIKIDFKVIEAPPGIQGDRSSAGTKTVTLENGTVVQVPLFINQDDIIRINTETGEYAERVEKA